MGVPNNEPKIQVDPSADQQLADAPQTPDDASILNSAGIICRALPGLVAAQVEVCQNFPNTIKSVSEGAKRGILECQYQFRHERWNCTSSRQDELQRELQRGESTT